MRATLKRRHDWGNRGNQWQQVVVIDFDTRPRRRNIAFQFIGR